MKKIIVSVIAGCVVSLTNAAVTFEYNFTDANGVGFRDASQGDRMAAMASAGSYVASLFVNYDATIQVDVSSTDDETFLASAGAYSNISYPGTGFGSQGDVMVKILGGTDPNSNQADATVNWNFTTYAWELGNDYQDGEFDFFSTAVHELIHATGFLSEIGSDGSSAWGQTLGSAGTWSPFDQYVGDSAEYLIDNNFVLHADWAESSVGGSGENGLRFLGPNAVAANGGNPVYLYSPDEWEGGSSGSHLDDQAYGSTYIMEASTTDGAGIHTLSDLELAMLKDIGYTEIIPEPNSLAFIGLTSLAIILTRRFRI